MLSASQLRWFPSRNAKWLNWVDPSITVCCVIAELGGMEGNSRCVFESLPNDVQY